MVVNASGKRLAALASSLIVVLACSALMSSDAESINDLVPNAHIFESFDEGWGNRWFHSSDPKYTGLFMTAPTPGSSNAELKASSPLTCSSTCTAWRCTRYCVPPADHAAPQVLWPYGSAEQASGPVRGPGDPVRDHLPKGIWCAHPPLARGAPCPHACSVIAPHPAYIRHVIVLAAPLPHLTLPSPRRLAQTFPFSTPPHTFPAGSQSAEARTSSC